MCGGNRRRAARYNQMNALNGSLLGGVGGLAGQHHQHHSTSINALLEAVNNLAIKAHNSVPSATSAPSVAHGASIPSQPHRQTLARSVSRTTQELPAVTNNYIPSHQYSEKYDTASIHISNQKDQQLPPPPAYEAAVSTPDRPAAQILTRELSRATSRGVELPPQYQQVAGSTPRLSHLVEALSVAIAAHHSGSVRYRSVRRAQKALRDELYEEEVARREALYGRLRCGEKCEIWREVKAINFGY